MGICLVNQRRRREGRGVGVDDERGEIWVFLLKKKKKLITTDGWVFHELFNVLFLQAKIPPEILGSMWWAGGRRSFMGRDGAMGGAIFSESSAAGTCGYDERTWMCMHQKMR
jgi:hypothetical protein